MARSGCSSVALWCLLAASVCAAPPGSGDHLKVAQGGGAVWELAVPEGATLLEYIEFSGADAGRGCGAAASFTASVSGVSAMDPEPVIAGFGKPPAVLNVLQNATADTVTVSIAAATCPLGIAATGMWLSVGSESLATTIAASMSDGEVYSEVAVPLQDPYTYVSEASVTLTSDPPGAAAVTVLFDVVPAVAAEEELVFASAGAVHAVPVERLLRAAPGGGVPSVLCNLTRVSNPAGAVAFTIALTSFSVSDGANTTEAPAISRGDDDETEEWHMGGALVVVGAAALAFVLLLWCLRINRRKRAAQLNGNGNREMDDF